MFKIYLFTIFLILGITNLSIAQRIPDPNKGDNKNTQWGILDGNMVRTLYANHGEIADWPNQPSGEWPKGSAKSYVDGVAFIVSVETQDKWGDIIHPMSTNYREFIDLDPITKIPWGWAPLPGYSNTLQSSPARSDDRNTWPTTWPDKPDDWDNFWNGYFGKGVRNADVETYFVCDDSPDKEWLNAPHYFRPDSKDSTRGGLGIEAAIRGFQWSHVLAQDIIFWHFEITNEATTGFDKVYFANYIDWGVGGTQDSGDDEGAYNTELDIAFAWDYDGLGKPGKWGPVGVVGYAFLESPGVETDGRDNDDDGIIDESRTSGPGIYLDKYPYGIDDVDKFIRFYGRAPGPHWSGDEDNDWCTFSDLNENGICDPGEPLNDDVGSDGIGPIDESYTEPDQGEGDGIPTPGSEGEPGEPNFDNTDKDESDQIGLTGFSIFDVHDYELIKDEEDWQLFSQALPPLENLSLEGGRNLGMFFSSGYFPLVPAQTERFSMALIFADKDFGDPAEVNYSALARKKKTVQQIYNANYRFAKPPDKPTIKVVPGDGQVAIYWDDRAESSYDPFVQEYDFEGYRIYRSTEPSFLESQIITDSYGSLTFRKPIAQFDLDNGLKGTHPVDINGIQFDLGNDTGLRHFYIDRAVRNGQTYYYAVVSYDRGQILTTVDGHIDTDKLGHTRGIAPSECASTLVVDISGNVKTDINTAVVVPRAPAAGYSASEIVGEITHYGPGSGHLEINIIEPELIPDDHSFDFIVHEKSRLYNAAIPTYSLINTTTDDTLIANRKISFYGQEIPFFQGVVGIIYNDSTVKTIDSATKWLTGQTNYRIKIKDIIEDYRLSETIYSLFSKYRELYPADLEIRFTENHADTSEYIRYLTDAIPTPFYIWNETETKRMPFAIVENKGTKDGRFQFAETLIILAGDSAHLEPDFSRYKFTASYAIEFVPPEDTLITPIPPQADDVFQISTTKPFRDGEIFSFKLKGEKYQEQQAKTDLDKIAVVPNPYVCASGFEPPNVYKSGRGERRVCFINLPAKCTIRIYTVRGRLVQTIEHDAAIANGQETWDLVSKDGMDIAYGIYIYHVEARDPYESDKVIAEKIGRLAVIK